MATTKSIQSQIIAIYRQLADDTYRLSFPSVHHVYYPYNYAWNMAESYVTQFARAKPKAILLGMNPGPYGMMQTGVPFGEIEAVRDWMGLNEPILTPSVEHPRRPIQGLDCPRSEVSGRRLWSWAQERFGSADAFFAQFFVHNYCPLAFLAETGRNITPDKLPVAELEPLQQACDKALVRLVDVMEPQQVVGIGVFAQKQAQRCLDREVGKILHPSPASPAANRGWAEAAEQQMVELGLI